MSSKQEMTSVGMIEEINYMFRCFFLMFLHIFGTLLPLEALFICQYLKERAYIASEDSWGEQEVDHEVNQ